MKRSAVTAAGLGRLMAFYCSELDLSVWLQYSYMPLDQAAVFIEQGIINSARRAQGQSAVS